MALFSALEQTHCARDRPQLQWLALQLQWQSPQLQRQSPLLQWRSAQLQWRALSHSGDPQGPFDGGLTGRAVSGGIVPWQVPVAADTHALSPLLISLRAQRGAAKTNRSVWRHCCPDRRFPSRHVKRWHAAWPQTSPLDALVDSDT